MKFLNKKWFCLLFVLVMLQTVSGMHPNVGLDEYQIMTKYGYPYEKHYVTTEDGYILEMSRVLPRKLEETKNSSIPFKVYTQFMAKTPGEPMLLMHGLISSGRAFVSHDAEKALAFILVNHGYDVYIGNARGAFRSRRHITLDPDVDVDSEKFWDFSWHEIGVYDQPAMIDYILNMTGFKQVSYVGHSQGGTTFLTMTAGRPETNEKIKIGFSLGGPGIMRYTASTLVRRFVSYEKDFQAMFKRLKIYEFIRYSPVFMDIGKIMADKQFGLRGLLAEFLNTLNIITTYNADLDLLPVLTSSSPSGASMNQVLHYMQCIRLGDFRLYDYHDKKKNFQKYGSSIPPRYNLSAITTKAIMYYSKDDMFIRGRDTKLMSNQMPNAIPVEIKVDKFSHADYMWAREINDILFKDLLWRLRNA